VLRFNTGSKRFRAGWVVGKLLTLRQEAKSCPSDLRLLLISRLKVRFLPRSPFIINNLQESFRPGRPVGVSWSGIVQSDDVPSNQKDMAEGV
jgi:hypothetical protein